jgi:hypothetical protein
MIAKNEKEFKALIRKYRRITLKRIETEKDKIFQFHLSFGCQVMSGITGFGTTTGCSLCQNIKWCGSCIYNVVTGWDCGDAGNAKTYNKICYATTPKELFKAINERADYMETILAKYEKQNKKTVK